jgi:CDP-4-dehydro-6-deoxyglucose reductase
MHQVTLQPSGRTFPAPEGKTILEAGLEAGIALPYSCRAAVCYTCRARIRTGNIDHGVVFGTLSDTDKKLGYALLCRAKPMGDVVVEVRELTGLEGIHPRVLPCRVVSVGRAASDVAILRIRVPNAEGLHFLAGQYVDFLLPDGQRRSFSIATKPSRVHVTELEFHVRKVSGGTFTSRVFDELKARDVLRLQAPLGTFYLRGDSTKPIIMLATGTGFAPIKAMYEAGVEQGTFGERAAVFYWGGRSKSDLYLLSTALSWNHPNVRVVPVLSRPTAECQWFGVTGLVHRAVMADFPDLSGHQVYACGSPAMVESARADFVSRCRLPKDEFFADSFLTQSDRVNAEAAAVIPEQQQEGKTSYESN